MNCPGGTGEVSFFARKTPTAVTTASGRLMFPICDEQGRIVGFSGRILSGDEKAAKYVNSPETPIFTKGRVFYGLDKSKRAILDAGFAVICEGNSISSRVTWRACAISSRLKALHSLQTMRAS
jgi:DNA primase